MRAASGGFQGRISTDEGPRRRAGCRPGGALRADRARVGAGRAGGLHRRAPRRDAAAGAGHRDRVDRRADARPAAPRRSRSNERTPEFAFVRALAIEAFYSDFVEPGRDVPGRLGGDRLRPAGRTAPAEGLVVPGHRMKDRFDVIVVGSGAGGGVVAGELAERGRDVLLLEAGPHLTAVDFDRWEAKATHQFWWPIRFGLLPDGDVGRVPRRPLRRRDDDDQHEGGAAGPREGRGEVASGDRPDERRLDAVLARRAGAVLRAGRAAARRARAQRLAALRAHDRGGVPRARPRARARHCRTRTATACTAARASRAARRTPASRPGTPTSPTPGRAACSSSGRTRPSTAW